MTNPPNQINGSNAAAGNDVGRDLNQNLINVNDAGTLGQVNNSGTVYGAAVGVNHGSITINTYVGVKPDVDPLPRAIEILDSLPTERVPLRSPGLPPNARILFAPVAEFVGRAAELTQIATILKSERTAAITPVAAAAGYGGIGKTSIANEFVHRYGQYFAGGVFCCRLPKLMVWQVKSPRVGR